MLLNPEDVGLDYIEDCQVCCRPIEFHLREQAGGWLEAEFGLMLSEPPRNELLLRYSPRIPR